MTDYSRGLYQNKNNGLIIPFDSFNIDFTDESNWTTLPNHLKSLPKTFLINLKNNEKIDSIPTQKYKLITCTYGYMNCLSLSASYKMTLQIPHLISTIAMSLKLIEDNELVFFCNIKLMENKN